ncbi:MAG: hypothetical protein WD875_11145 [Pirellulales bacterium]
MIPQEKIREICERLLAKSRTNRVNWLQYGENGYGVRFSAGGIEIGFYSPPTEPDEIRVSVTNPDGRTVGQWLVSQDDDEQWPLFWGLYQDAERCVSGWDQVLNGIEAAIGSEGTIGINEPIASDTREAFAPPFGDIPF